MKYLAIYSKYLKLEKRGKKYFALCPFHAESEPSFTINPETGTFYCFGCGAKGNVKQFLENIKQQGIEVKDDDIQFQNEKNEKREHKKLSIKDYDELYENKTYYKYFDFYGNLVYTKIRYDTPKKDGIKSKTFVIEPSGKSHRLYNEYLLENIKNDKNVKIWLTEGEKCADAVDDALQETEYQAVVLGFNNFKNEFEVLVDEAKEVFRNRKIVIFQDNDEAGKKKVEEAVEVLKKYAYEIDVVKFTGKPEHYDIGDFLEEGHQISDALMLAETVYVSPVSCIEVGFNNARIEPEEEWILEPFVPTKTIVLLDGLGGLGKSTFAMQLCFSICTGKNFLLPEIQPKEPSLILYITAEETPYRFQQRGLKIQEIYGATNNFLWVSTLSKSYNLNTSRIMRRENSQITPTEAADFLLSAIDKFLPKLIILDSFINFYGLDENKTEEAAVFYDFIKQIIKKYNCSFLFLHHQTKEAMRGQNNIFRGSSVFREQARTRIVMAKKGGKKILEIEKSNYHSPLLEMFPMQIEFVDGCWCVRQMRVQIEKNEDEKNEKGHEEDNRGNESEKKKIKKKG
ncbi:MAG: AAA family ATPase [Candidatus Methanofastidiosum sp.]|nr:AAA family ATPase [Methanofastidiosum sp.]